MPGEGENKPNESKPTPPKRPLTRRPLVLLIAAAVLGLAAYYGVRRYLHSRSYQSTDDAFVDAHVVAVSPRVASYAARVLVDDNEHVTKGQLLVELDPRDFQAKLNQARANLSAGTANHQAASINVDVVAQTSSAGVQQAEAAVATARSQADAARSQIGAAQAERVAAETEASRSAADVQRYQQLLKTNAVSRQQTDNAVAAHRTANARLNAAIKSEASARAALDEAQAQVDQAEAKLKEARAAPDQVAYSKAQATEAQAKVSQLESAVRLAELELSYTRIYASTDGRVTRRSVEVGDYLQPGQRILSLVPDQVWVVANFKETQLKVIRPGQSATVKFDAYPNRIFHGHVESIQAGSGAAFSLLPPENATGNYVKVVQRVPVKIVIDDKPDPAHVVLGPGMSAVPTVKVR